LLADFLAVRPLVVFFPVDFLAAAVFLAVDFRALELPLLDFLAGDFRALALLPDFLPGGLRPLELLLDFLAVDFRVPELPLDFFAADFLPVDFRVLPLPLLEALFLLVERSSDESEFLSSSWPSSSLFTTSLSRISPRQPSCSSCSSMVCIVISRRN
jgi:hypothetical protein